jgi:hypothetical protein
MAVHAHDVSHELRDRRGRWARSGALRRMAQEVIDSQSLSSVFTKVQAIEPDKGRNIGGHWVDRPASEGHRYRVKLKTTDKGKRDVKIYDTPGEAAAAIHQESHLGSPPSPPREPFRPPGVPRENPPREPFRPAKAPFTGKWNIENEFVKGTPENIFNQLQDLGINTIPAKKMIVAAHLHGTSEVEEGLFVQYDRSTDRYKVHTIARPQTEQEKQARAEEEAFRRSATTGGVHHPKSLVVKVQVPAEDKKRMRQQVLKATTKQAEITPDLVDRTDITITRTPHGASGKSSTLASHTGIGNTLHIKPEVLISDNAQAVLEHNRGGWWVPTDHEHDLSMNVLTHEFGHGVHGELNRLGVIKANRNNATIYDEEERNFWNGFADSLNEGMPYEVRKPKTGFKDASGRPGINVIHWHSQNRAAIEKVIGRYAGHNMNEMIAELWTEYRLSGNPRPPAKFFGDYVKEHLDLHNYLLNN